MSASIALTGSAKQEQVEGFNLLVKWKGQDVPVIQAPELATLFPKRSATAFDALKLSILANGQEGRCLYCSLDKKTLLCIDGHDTSKAFAELRKEGRLVEVAWDLYEPMASSRERILLELMAIVIRRKNLQTAVVIEEGVKELAIRQYLVNWYSQGTFPTDRWVAEDVGCSDTWVGKIRRRAVKAGLLMDVAEYDTRNGRKRTAQTKREVFAETETIPIGIGLPAKLESEITEVDLEREKRRRKRRQGRRMKSSRKPMRGTTSNRQRHPPLLGRKRRLPRWKPKPRGRRFQRRLSGMRHGSPRRWWS